MLLVYTMPSSATVYDYSSKYKQLHEIIYHLSNSEGFAYQLHNNNNFDEEMIYLDFQSPK